MIPLAGPLIVAVVATAMAPELVLRVLAFLAVLRVVQDYLIYPRLISSTMHLHPIAVVLAIWAGAALGGLVGVCLAIPLVGTLQVTLRHWRDAFESGTVKATGPVEILRLIQSVVEKQEERTRTRKLRAR